MWPHIVEALSAEGFVGVYIGIGVLMAVLICALTTILAVRVWRALRTSHGVTHKSGQHLNSDETSLLPIWVWWIPSFLSYSLVVINTMVPLLYPVQFLVVARHVLRFYLVYALFYASIVLFGLCRIIMQEHEYLPVKDEKSNFYYAFFVPNYMEDIEVLECTLANLAAHPYAKRCV